MNKLLSAMLIILLLAVKCYAEESTLAATGYAGELSLTYGGKCKNAEDSIVVIDGINVREECKDNGTIAEYVSDDRYLLYDSPKDVIFEWYHDENYGEFLTGVKVVWPKEEGGIPYGMAFPKGTRIELMKEEK